MANRNLLYLTVGGDKDYYKLLDLFLRSLEATSTLENIDVLIFMTGNNLENYVTTTKIQAEIKFLAPPKINKQTKSIKIYDDLVCLPYDKMIYSIQKVRIFEISEFYNYEKILYLDVDCVVCDDIAKAFDLIDDKSLLHVCKDTDDFEKHNCLYYNTGQYRSDFMDRIRSKNIFPFSGGIYGFKPSEIMAYHFKTVYGQICKCEADFFYEQSHLNQYFNKNCLSKDVFSDFVLTPSNENKFLGKSPLILHYAASHIPPAKKREVLAAYFANLKR